jgi:hypothetical protein
VRVVAFCANNFVIRAPHDSELAVATFMHYLFPALIDQAGPIYETVAEGLTTDHDRNLTVNETWVLHGLWCAFRALRLYVNGCTPLAIMFWVVKLPGDRGSNASIVGALVGCVCGYEAIAEDKQCCSNIEVLMRPDHSCYTLKYTVESIPKKR